MAVTFCAGDRQQSVLMTYALYHLLPATPGTYTLINFSHAQKDGCRRYHLSCYRRL